MKAWIIESFDGIDKMRLAELADPKPGVNEVLLRVGYAALNPADAYLAQGQYPSKPPLPHILGRDGMGEVVAVGPNVKEIDRGERRLILRSDIGIGRWGTFAPLVAVPVESLIEIPEGWSDEQAGAGTLVYLTAHQALTQWDRMPTPATVLISGASGGVGVASTQLALAIGHKVVGLSRDPQKRLKLVSMGMTLALDPSDPNWREDLNKALGKNCVNLVIDNVGGELFNELIATLAEFGHVSVVGRLAGPVPKFNTSSLLFRRLRIGGVAVGAYSISESRMAWQQVLQFLSKTGAKPVIDEVFSFDELPAAFAKLARGPMGKVLIRI